MNGELDARTGVKETIPTVLGYIGIGLAFGIIAHTSGFTALEATLMSLLVYTGAGEFALVSMYAAGSSVFAIALAVTLMSSRMLLMSLTLAPKFKVERLVKNLWLGFLLTDETFALAITKLNYTDGKLSYDWLNASNLMAYLTWAGSSCLGALLGSLVPDTKALGLDFAVAAMFLGLLYLQLISDKAVEFNLQLIMIGVTALLTYLGMIVLPSSAVTIVVTFAGCLLGMGIKHAFFK